MTLEKQIAKVEKIQPEKYDLYPDSIKVPICNKCIHYISGTVTCKAFKKRIPESILDGSNKHQVPFPGDNGIQFEPIS